MCIRDSKKANIKISFDESVNVGLIPSVHPGDCASALADADYLVVLRLPEMTSFVMDTKDAHSVEGFLNGQLKKDITREEAFQIATKITTEGEQQQIE